MTNKDMCTCSDLLLTKTSLKSESPFNLILSNTAYGGFIPTLWCTIWKYCCKCCICTFTGQKLYVNMECTYTGQKN